EYQARDLFEKHGVPVLKAQVVTTPEAAKTSAEVFGGGTVVVKTQVKIGGRGKAGGVKVAKNPDEAEARAKDILGLDIKGHISEKVMIAEGADIAEEYYFSVLLDRSNRTYLAMCSKEGGMELEQLAVERADALAKIPVSAIDGIDAANAAKIAPTAFSVLLDRSNRTYLAMCSKEGGMEIEQLAVERPDALAKIPVSAIDGIDADKAAEIAQAAGFDAETAAKVAPVLTSLWTAFENED